MRHIPCPRRWLTLAKAVVTKKDREESLLEYIKTLGSQLPLMDFYSNVFPTNEMKECVAKIFVAVMKLLDEAVSYYRGGKLSMSFSIRLSI